MDPEPRPVQRPIPILVGGHSDIALERAGRIGDGWIAAQMSPERVAEHWPKVVAAAERNGRDPGSVRLFTSVSGRVDLPLGDLLAQYRDLGVDHVQVGLHRDSRSETLDKIRDVAENVLPTLRARSEHGRDRRTEARDPHPGDRTRDPGAAAGPEPEPTVAPPPAVPEPVGG